MIGISLARNMDSFDIQQSYPQLSDHVRDFIISIEEPTPNYLAT